MKYLPLLIISILFFQCCTIEKRLYNKGYHLEWKGSSKHSEQQKSEQHDIAFKGSERNEAAEIPAKTNIELDEEEAVFRSEDLIVENTEMATNDLSQKIPEIQKDTVYIYDYVENEPFGVASAVSLLASGLTVFVPILSIGYIGLALFGAAFVLSIISMIRFAMNRGYYKSNILGVITFFACLAIMILVAVLIIVLFF